MVHMLEDADVIAQAVAFILEARMTEGLTTLMKLSKDETFPTPTADPSAPPFTHLVRKSEKSLTDEDRFRIYERGGWRCRYCRRKLVVAPVLLYLREVFPNFKGARIGYAMSKLDTEPAIARVYSVVDHSHPQKFGGGNSDNNLAAACDRCNTAKGDKPGWSLLPIMRDEWRGVFPSLTDLAKIANHSGARTWLSIAAAAALRENR
jgi:hypothetical protein